MNKFLFLYAALRAPDDGSGSGDAAASGETGAAATVLGGDAPAVPAAPGAADLMYPDGQKPGEEAKPADGEKPGGEWKEYVTDPSKTDEENAALKAEHDKTKPAEEAEDDKGKKKDGEEDKAEAPKPEDYDLSPPEGFDVDPEVEKEFRSFASENGFSKETVGKLKDLQVKLYEKQSAAHAERVAQWGEELKANKEIGGQKYDENIGVARAAIREFFPEGAKKMLDATGLGNHPDIVVGFVRMGRAMGEGKTLTGNPTSRMNIVDAMYGNE